LWHGDANVRRDETMTCDDSAEYDIDDECTEWWERSDGSPVAVPVGAAGCGGPWEGGGTVGIAAMGCGLAPHGTPYAYGYTFIEGLLSAQNFDALVRPERRLVVTLPDGRPLAVDAADIERAGRVGRPLATPLGTCSLTSLDTEAARETDEDLREREGLQRALTTMPLGETLEVALVPGVVAATGGAAAMTAGAGAVAEESTGLLAGLLGLAGLAL
jgi:hypothetical protein